MRELIHIGLGRCGVGIGLKFYELLASEYQIENRVCDKPGEGIEVHFNEIADHKFVPRSILLCNDIDQIMANPTGLLFNPNNYQQDISEVLRKELELCSNCQGFQISNHLSTDLKCLDDIDTKLTVQTYTVFPQLENSLDVVQSLKNLEKLRDYNVIAFDNDALNDYYCKQYRNQLNFSDYNQVIGTVMSGITAPMRQTSSNNISMDNLYHLRYKLNIDVCSLSQDKNAYNSLSQLIDIKPLITTLSQKPRILETVLLFKSGSMQPHQISNQLTQLQPLFYSNQLNVRHTITQSKQDQLIMLSKSSQIHTQVNNLYTITKKQQPRKPFNESIQWDSITQDLYNYIENILQICTELEQGGTEQPAVIQAPQEEQQIIQEQQSSQQYASEAIKPQLRNQDANIESNQNGLQLQSSNRFVSE